MALAVRMKMVTANDQVIEKIVIDCVSRAINASKSAVVESPTLEIVNFFCLFAIYYIVTKILSWFKALSENCLQ